MIYPKHVAPLKGTNITLFVGMLLFAAFLVVACGNRPRPPGTSAVGTSSVETAARRAHAGSIEKAMVRDQTIGVEEIPTIGARVRVVVPKLGPGWRTGMFNRTRQEPPCYVVLLPDPGPIRKIAATVYMGAITRLQLSTLYTGTGALDPDPGAASYDGEHWREVTISAIKSAGRNDCPASVDTRQ